MRPAEVAGPTYPEGSMRRSRKLLVIMFALALACRDTTTAPPISQQVFQSIRESLSGPSTSAPAQAYALAPAASVTPIITSGDAVGEAGYVLGPKQDGLGVYDDGANVI